MRTRTTFLTLAVAMSLAATACSAKPVSAPTAASERPSPTQSFGPQSTNSPPASKPTAAPKATATPKATAHPKATPTPASGSSAGKISFSDPQNYRVDFVSTVQDTGWNTSRMIVYEPRPISWDGQKNVKIESVSPSPTKSGKDSVYGDGIYYWQILNRPTTGTSIPFEIQFTFTAYQTSATVDATRLKPYNKTSALYKLYTRPERFIESKDPQIVALANTIAGGSTDPYDLARKFYDYIVANAHYQKVGKGLLGAKALLTDGVGECGDFSSLFIALARARGIPARPVVGFWADSGTDQYHVWAEFYIEGVGWIPVDPTVGQNSPSAAAFYFGNMDNQRVILEKGFNIPMSPATPNGSLVALMQGPWWWFWGSGDTGSMTIGVTEWQVTPI